MVDEFLLLRRRRLLLIYFFVFVKIWRCESAEHTFINYVDDKVGGEESVAGDVLNFNSKTVPFKVEM